jgi:hypothetical protein
MAERNKRRRHELVFIIADAVSESGPPQGDNGERARERASVHNSDRHAIEIGACVYMTFLIYLMKVPFETIATEGRSS